MTKIPPDDILEGLYKLRIRESEKLKNVLELYDMEIHQKISVPNNQKLKTMVKRCVDQKLQSRNFDARHGRIQSGAVAKSRMGIIGVEGGKRICYQWKEKGQCSQGDRCSFRHDTQDRAQKPEHTAATPSEPAPSRSGSVLGREVSEAMGAFFDNRVDIIWRVHARERLVNIDIRPSANSIKMKRAVKQGISVYSGITRLMKNQT